MLSNCFQSRRDDSYYYPYNSYHVVQLNKMKFDPEKHHRRSIRLPEYDYSQPGGYYITILTHNRECLFGDVVDGKMVLNDAGKIVRDEWLKTAEIRTEIELDEFIVMPNHVHGIIFIVDGYRRGDPPVAPTKPGPKPKSIGSIMAGFKSAVTKRINQMRNTSEFTVWQRNYWEHIIRDEHDLNRIREYIINNPLRWELDNDNPMKKIERIHVRLPRRNDK